MNANVQLISANNVFGDWLASFNVTANVLNSLLNGTLWCDNGSLVLQNGSILLLGSNTTLSVTSNATISGNATIGALTVTSNTTSGNVKVTQNVSSGNLSVAGNVATGNVSVTGNITTSQNGSFGNVTVTQNAAIGNLSLSGALSGVSNLSVGNVVVTQNISGGNLSITQNTSTGNLVVLKNATMAGGTLTANSIQLDNTATYSIVQGNAIINNLTVIGNQIIEGATVLTTDTFQLRSNTVTDGDGFIKVYRGSGSNATFKFNHTSNIWQATANDAQSYVTLLSTANVIDSTANAAGSQANVPSANIFAFVAALSSGAQANALAAYSKANSAANTVRTSANGGSTILANGLNFVNTANVTVAITYDGTGNANIAINSSAGQPPGGSNTQIQFNDTVVGNATFNGSPNLTWTKSTNVLEVIGSIGVGIGNPQFPVDVIGVVHGNAHSELYANIGTSGANVNCAQGAFFDYTLTSNPTLWFNSCVPAGNTTTIQIMLRQDPTGSRTVTWGNLIAWSDNLVPTLTTTSNHADILQFTTFSGGQMWFGAQVYANIAGMNTAVSYV